MKEIVRKVIAIAENEMGVREVGENMGERVNEYQRADTLGGVGYAWCASFIAWCLKQADPDITYCYSASCDVIVAWGRSMGVMHEAPNPGDIFLLFAAGSTRDATHTGLVTAVNGSQFHTVEGNTNLDGGREGIGVFARKRTNGNRYRFVRWADLHSGGPEPYSVRIGSNLLEGKMVGAATFVAIRDWGEALGFEVEWNNDKQVPLFDGREVPVQVNKIGSRGYAWVRALAEFSGLRLDVDTDDRVITVRRIGVP